MDEWQLSQSSKLFHVMFEIYNLAWVIRRHQSLRTSARTRIPKLKTEIRNNFLETFTGTKRTHNGGNGDETRPTKQSRTNQGGHVDGGIQHGDIYDTYEVAEAFAKAGYVLERNGEDENGWTPLNEVKAMKHFGICRLELMRCI